MFLLSLSASSTGNARPSAPGPRTDSNHALPLSGGSSTTARRDRAVPLTASAHRAILPDTSDAAALGAMNDEPSRRVVTASATAAGVRVLGGGAGRSTSDAASCPIASTTAPTISSVTVRASVTPNAATGAGMALASRSTSVPSRSAGAHRTDSSTSAFSRRWAERTVGTSRPVATVLTASMATRPIQRTLAPSLGASSWPPTCTSQPSAFSTGIATASAVAPSAKDTSECGLHPRAGPPIASSRSASSSLVAADADGPAAHTTS